MTHKNIYVLGALLMLLLRNKPKISYLKCLVWCWSLLGLPQAAFAQNKCSNWQVQFAYQWGEQVLCAEQWYKLASGDSIFIENVKFYVGNVQMRGKGKELATYKDNYLVDLQDSLSQRIVLCNVPDGVDTFCFDLGVDSLTNLSGARGGALDPTKGMYWTWQSGYINLKIEGYSPLCATRKQTFQLHIGGYRTPYATLQTLSLAVGQERGKSSKTIFIDLKQLFSKIDLKTQHSIMIPGRDAHLIAQQFAQIFSLE